MAKLDKQPNPDYYYLYIGSVEVLQSLPSGSEDEPERIHTELGPKVDLKPIFSHQSLIQFVVSGVVKGATVSI